MSLSLWGGRRHRSGLRVSQDSGTGQPNRYATLDHLDIPRQVVVLPPLLTRKVGTLSLFYVVWRQRRCSEWVCNVLEVGFRLRFRECPPWLLPHLRLLTRDLRWSAQPSCRWYSPCNKKYVVEVVCDTTSPGCYSQLFLEIPHFTMENAESIRRSLPRDAWVTSIDLVDTYFHIPIHRGYRKCLRFQIRNTIYQFRALSFRLSPAPWVCSKIMTEMKMLVHVMGINLCQYLDDWLIYSLSHDQWLRDTVQVLNICHTMGLFINDKKSQMIPKQKFLFLGYQFYLVSFQVTPTVGRYHKIKHLFTYSC